MELHGALVNPNSKIKNPALKKFLIFSQKKLFLYLGKRNFVMFSKEKIKKMEVSSLMNKKLRKASKVENPL